MAEDPETGNGESLPRFRSRKSDEEQVELSEKRDRKHNWLVDVILFIINWGSSH
jgi:hypothetical protein